MHNGCSCLALLMQTNIAFLFSRAFASDLFHSNDTTCMSPRLVSTPPERTGHREDDESKAIVSVDCIIYVLGHCQQLAPLCLGVGSGLPRISVNRYCWLNTTGRCIVNVTARAAFQISSLPTLKVYRSEVSWHFFVLHSPQLAKSSVIEGNILRTLSAHSSMALPT